MLHVAHISTHTGDTLHGYPCGTPTLAGRRPNKRIWGKTRWELAMLGGKGRGAPGRVKGNKKGEEHGCMLRAGSRETPTSTS